MRREVLDRNIEASVGHDPAFVDRVFVGMAQRHADIVVLVVRKLEAAEHLGQAEGGIERPLQRLDQRAQVALARRLVEAADLEVDRMGRASADHLEDRVAKLLELQRRLDDLGIVLGQLQRVLEPQEVGGVQHGRVQDVALDPFTAVNQPAQVADRPCDLDAQRLFHGVAGAHLIGDRADAADAGRDVGGIAVDPALQEGLEETRRLEDAEADVLDLVVLDADMQRALAFDAGQRIDLDGTGHHRRLGLGRGFPLGGGLRLGRLSSWSDFSLAPYSWVKLSCRNSTRVGVVGPEKVLDGPLVHVHAGEPLAEAGCVGGFLRPEAAVAAAVEGRAQIAAASLRNAGPGTACRAPPSRRRSRSACTRCTGCAAG